MGSYLQRARQPGSMETFSSTHLTPSRFVAVYGAFKLWPSHPEAVLGMGLAYRVGLVHGIASREIRDIWPKLKLLSVSVDRLKP
ncbi:hypothetical protein GGP41_008426 [Bipolaris sorokiniana]|uniref:Uncharacterized protein n=1 Tax=Cochliobolus sativus TaxID=45130 RepID=A0A8H5ZAS0_COCSA|nr:hypothetical protein GGP41_008426 [Bipolaris sorokiniana]